MPGPKKPFPIEKRFITKKGRERHPPPKPSPKQALSFSTYGRLNPDGTVMVRATVGVKDKQTGKWARQRRWIRVKDISAATRRKAHILEKEATEEQLTVHSARTAITLLNWINELGKYMTKEQKAAIGRELHNLNEQYREETRQHPEKIIVAEKLRKALEQFREGNLPATATSLLPAIEALTYTAEDISSIRRGVRRMKKPFAAKREEMEKRDRDIIRSVGGYLSALRITPTTTTLKGMAVNMMNMVNLHLGRVRFPGHKRARAILGAQIRNLNEAAKLSGPERAKLIESIKKELEKVKLLIEKPYERFPRV